MNERRDDLTTADLAGQQPTDTAPPDRAAVPDGQRRDLTDDELRTDGELGTDEELGPDGELRTDEELRTDSELRREEFAAEERPTAPDHGTGASAATTGPLLAADDAEGFRARWTDVQTGFVDAPRRAVEQADALVAELMQHLASTFADERGRLERQWDQGDDVPTDHLRDAFQRYRSFFERLLST
jgi:hypothetical protein